MYVQRFGREGHCFVHGPGRQGQVEVDRAYFESGAIVF